MYDNTKLFKEILDNRNKFLNFALMRQFENYRGRKMKKNLTEAMPL